MIHSSSKGRQPPEKRKTRVAILGGYGPCTARPSQRLGRQFVRLKGPDSEMRWILEPTGVSYWSATVVVRIES